MAATQETEQGTESGPLYWFVLLELALERSDFQAAADAQRELRRLGVDVRYRRWSAPIRKAVPCVQ